MFESARLKLTAWYLMIIMLICVFFSAVIYSIATDELERVINRMEYRQAHPNVAIPERPQMLLKEHRMLSIEEFEDTKRRLLIILAMINSGIFIVAGAIGYFLAGETLSPIRIMVEEQNEFISNASHELRTPIATIRAEMEGQLLEKNISQQAHRKLIKSSLEEVQTLQELTDNLLSLANVYDKQSSVVFKELVLADIIVESKKRIIRSAQEKHINISQELLAGSVYGDKTGLISVFTILLDNAIKYSPSKSTITIRSAKAGKFYKISVIDQGSGISKKDLPHLFERFYRADRSRSQQKGFGLGLAIAKKIVENHQGLLQIKSSVGSGTTCIVTLPKR